MFTAIVQMFNGPVGGDLKNFFDEIEPSTDGYYEEEFKYLGGGVEAVYERALLESSARKYDNYLITIVDETSWYGDPSNPF